MGFEDLITPAIATAIFVFIWRLAVAIIEKNKHKEVRAVLKPNGDTELFLKGHAHRHEAALIRQLNPKLNAQRKR